MKYAIVVLLTSCAYPQTPEALSAACKLICVDHQGAAAWAPSPMGGVDCECTDGNSFLGYPTTEVTIK